MLILNSVIKPDVMSLGFLCLNLKTLLEPLRGVDIINLNPTTIANSNFALISAFFNVNLVELKCASNKMAGVHAHYGVSLTPSQVSAIIRNLKINFDDHISWGFQTAEPAKKSYLI
ncbi:hypothetical protein HZS_6946 [Henneguya salminicola]|nr:hypothetical protein HZS_6946 [Henneguya salminicola]